jgi:hypothetical protein
MGICHFEEVIYGGESRVLRLEIGWVLGAG